MQDMGVFMRNKIKNPWKKFKRWLIKKLGGYTTPPNTFEVKHTEVPLLELQAQITVPNNYLTKSQVADALSRQLAKEIMHYIEIRESIIPAFCETSYNGRIKIAAERRYDYDD